MVSLGPVSTPIEETVRMRQPQTAAFLERGPLGVGTLYVAERQVCWVGSDGNGFALPFKAISLHALSRDLSSFHDECIYLMLDPVKAGASPSEAAAFARAHRRPPAAAEQNGQGVEAEEEEEDGDDDEEPVAEMRFVPADKASLQLIYEALSECQALNPDSETELSDEQGDEDDDEGDEGDGEHAEEEECAGHAEGNGHDADMETDT